LRVLIKFNWHKYCTSANRFCKTKPFDWREVDLSKKVKIITLDEESNDPILATEIDQNI